MLSERKKIWRLIRVNALAANFLHTTIWHLTTECEPQINTICSPQLLMFFSVTTCRSLKIGTTRRNDFPSSPVASLRLVFQAWEPQGQVSSWIVVQSSAIAKLTESPSVLALARTQSSRVTAQRPRRAGATASRSYETRVKLQATSYSAGSGLSAEEPLSRIGSSCVRFAIRSGKLQLSTLLARALLFRAVYSLCWVIRAIDDRRSSREVHRRAVRLGRVRGLDWRPWRERGFCSPHRELLSPLRENEQQNVDRVRI